MSGFDLNKARALKEAIVYTQKQIEWYEAKVQRLKTNYMNKRMQVDELLYGQDNQQLKLYKYEDL